VIALWPLGLNPGISSAIRSVPELPVGYEQIYQPERAGSPGARQLVEWLRFAWRRPAPDGAGALAQLSARRRIVITSGRSESGKQVLISWLRRHGIDSFISDVHLSPGGLTPRQHKLATLSLHGIQEHVDDDPAAIGYLAAHGFEKLYFRAWPNTATTETPPVVARIESLTDLLNLIA
jgi:hypothetical protein